MTAPHLGDDVLVDLALGHVSAAERRPMLAHLVGCADCRAEYDGVSATIAELLPAITPVQPPLGFDAAVVAAMTEHRAAATSAARPRRRSRRRSILTVAAAAVLAVLIAGVAVTLTGRERAGEGQAVTLVAGARDVGTVSRQQVDGRDILVVAVVDAPEGVSYTCRMTMRDGTVVDSEPWPAVPRGAWVVDLPGVDAGDVARVDLVITGTDRVWSSAAL